MTILVLNTYTVKSLPSTNTHHMLACMHTHTHTYIYIYIL